jgi:hypothetical protein
MARPVPFGPASRAVPLPAFAQDGRGTKAFPIMEAIIELPAMLDPTQGRGSRANRIHSQAVKTAMRKTLEWHHRKRIWQHFNRFRQKKYKFDRRDQEYLRRKRFVGKEGPDTDLVRSGKTKFEMVNRFRLSVSNISGAAFGTLGKLTMRWPRGHKEPAGQRGVTKKVMADEIARFTNQEEKESAQQFVDFYLREVDKLTASRPRIRKRLGGRLRALRIS